MTNKKLTIIVCGFIVSLGFAFGIYGHFNKQEQTMSRLARETNSVFNRPHSPVYGPQDAKVRIVEFFDPACETCRAFYPRVKRLVDAQQGKVQLTLRYAPLHDGSDVAVKILDAARLQGKFWPVTEAALQAQPEWASHGAPNPERIWEFLGSTGLDMQKAKVDAVSPAVLAIVNQDIADAKELKVTKTPGFFVNGKPLKDFGIEELKALVEDEIKLAYPNGR
ncbi:DsbA family protein [Paracidovorax konjaci]|uniref:Protein-disulfide isomerase n=1 Tax=Paracidovorax konjaci TaxID=32040 RepID=A0A1I1U4K6_9BURK|nr:thioredoxin domain-containing protein [Paracidovorax konjaci]SFD62810.1 Protein-disulfide isomerase [Paracidovorax konjaci]